ncbi:MAG: hypothetical protein M3Z66_00515 [Chloroflexota bacterium]|nr:hypothetical protein [Chloroflexota bacterium]
MDSNAQITAATAEAHQHQVPPNVETLWRFIQEQRARIDSLEADRLPLPEASKRVDAGRRAVINRRRRPSSRAREQSVPAVEAFQTLAPITARYASLPILEGFNWSDCTAQLAPGEWYLVVFRSIRRQAADDLTLEMHDYGAYIEAQRRALGLVFYFRGTTNEQRECLSFCLWNSRQEAVRAAQLPLHRIAMNMVEEKYEWYRLERYAVRKVRDRPQVDIIPL